MMRKNGDSNPTFIGDYVISKKSTSKYTLELVEKDGKTAGVADEEVGYNPYENREVEYPTTNSETLFHLLKGSLGTGILAMPNAFRNAGYLTATIGTVIIGFICTYCIHQLVKAEYELCRRKKIHICHLKYKSTDTEMNGVVQKHFVHANDKIRKRKQCKTLEGSKHPRKE